MKLTLWIVHGRWDFGEGVGRAKWYGMDRIVLDVKIEEGFEVPSSMATSDNECSIGTLETHLHLREVKCYPIGKVAVILML